MPSVKLQPCDNLGFSHPSCQQMLCDIGQMHSHSWNQASTELISSRHLILADAFGIFKHGLLPVHLLLKANVVVVVVVVNDIRPCGIAAGCQFYGGQDSIIIECHTVAGLLLVQRRCC